MRTILLFALAMIAVYLVRGALQKHAASRSAREDSRREDAERMVACEHCGLHIPESESVRSDDATFCCAEHLRLHRDGDA